MDLKEFAKLAAAACKTPGKKIRSKGMGRGLARGKGKGPMGIPYYQKMKAMKGK
jgi:hypothetical protein